MKPLFCRAFWLVFLVLLSSAAPGWGRRFCVDAAATGTNTGACFSNWANAFPDLQSALAAASAGDEIWVAAGVYRPTPGSDRAVSFVLKDGVAIYGGFAGTETERNQRDWIARQAVLTGDLAGNDGPAPFQNDAENSYHVVVGSGTGATAVLDGFTITGGHANGQPPHHDGGGLYLANGSPTLRNLVFERNRAENGYGGGLFYVGSGAPGIRGCRFRGNQALYGGGMSSGGAAQVTHCLFDGNQAALGGAIFIHTAATELSNCTLAGNTAEVNGFTGFGGGAYVYSGNLILNNSLVALNVPTDVEGPVVSNCTTIGGDPQFADPAAGDYRLQPSSAAVDAGCSGLVPAGILTDLDAQPRFVDVPSAADTGTGTPPLVDRGAYELQFRRNRYLSFNPGPAGQSVALRITLIQTALGGGFSGLVGARWWVQPHAATDPPAVFRLGCTAHYQDWGSVPLSIDVGDDEIFPASRYRLDAVLASGAVNPLPIHLSTVNLWGDVAGPKVASGWPPPDGLVTQDDVDASVECFQGLPAVPPLASCDVDPAVPNAIVNVLDISRIVDAKAGYPYPFPAPGRCLAPPIEEQAQ